MLIISTSPVAAIIRAVSPESIFGCAASSANAGAALDSMAKNAMHVVRIRDVSAVMMSPVSPQLPRSLRSAQKAHERSQCIRISLAGADAHRSFDGCDENLAVANLAGLGGVRDRFHDLVDVVVVDGDVESHLGQKIHRV